jgi:hypothetical protein
MGNAFVTAWVFVEVDLTLCVLLILLVHSDSCGCMIIIMFINKFHLVGRSVERVFVCLFFFTCTSILLRGK